MKKVIPEKRYWTDDVLYIAYKLLNIQRFSKASIASFEDLRPPKAGIESVGMHMQLLMDHLDLRLHDFVFHKKIYETFYDDYDKVVEQLDSISEEAELKALTNILNSDFTEEDFINLPLTQTSIYNFFYFKADLPPATEKTLKDYLDGYIYKYLNGGLEVEDKNIEIFSEQKKSFDSTIYELMQRCGKTFLIDKETLSLSLNPPNFFVHNIIALEHLGLIAVNDFFILNPGKDITKQAERYNAKVTVLPKYIQEYEDKEQARASGVKDSNDTVIKKIAGQLSKEFDEDIVAVIANLERRFQALLEHQRRDLFDTFFYDYINFLGRSKTVGGIIEKLALEGKIGKKIFNGLATDFIISTIGKDIMVPTFLTKKVNDKFGTGEEVAKWLESEAEQFRKEKEEGKKPIFNVAEFMATSLDDDLFLARKLHNDILEELSNLQKPRELQGTNSKTKYNSDNGVLTLKSRQFDFSRKQNQKDLLKILFQEPQKNWHYDEVVEAWNDREYNKGDWRKFYTAGDEINKFIAIEVGIKDFIIKTTKKIRINAKYL